MSKRKGRWITVEDPNGLRLHAVWSRSGARLGLSLSKPNGDDYSQIELRPEQVQTLADFLAETAASPAADRLTAD